MEVLCQRNCGLRLLKVLWNYIILNAVARHYRATAFVSCHGDQRAEKSCTKVIVESKRQRRRLTQATPLLCELPTAKSFRANVVAWESPHESLILPRRIEILPTKTRNRDYLALWGSHDAPLLHTYNTKLYNLLFWCNVPEECCSFRKLFLIL